MTHRLLLSSFIQPGVRSPSRSIANVVRPTPSSRRGAAEQLGVPAGLLAAQLVPRVEAAQLDREDRGVDLVQALLVADLLEAIRYVRGSGWTSTGVAPVYVTANAVATYVLAGTSTSSPGPTAPARRASLSEAVL
jgi:hypothetical protein